VPPASLAARLFTSFEPDGSISDNASSELKRARQTLRRVRKHLVSFLQKKLRDTGADSVDGNVTVRGGRYVIPVRRDSRSRESGIVHGESSSGATVFVEPADAVPLGNELQAAESSERREEVRVLRELTDAVREHVDALADGWEMCVAVDDLYARGRYAVDVKAARPRLERAPSAFRIREGKHPLLLAELENVIPFELNADLETRVVLISGPNTGGKTVILKAVGLLSALAQAGIIPPIGEHTVLPVFDRIDADIGDHQSIAASLSTFSAHVQSLKRVLTHAGQGTLVLLDEFGTGTDPAEGAALGAAVLQKLVQLGCFTVATTHLGQLKQLASETAGVMNASLQFDPDRLEPTYQFSLGVPGRSYGLAMARTLGLPLDVVEEAESLRSDSEQSVDALLADLEQREVASRTRETEMKAAAQALAAERDGLDALRADLREQSTRLAAERKALETEGRETARRYLLQARQRVEEALSTARAAVDETTARAARRLVEEGVREEAAAIDKLELQARQQGWRVVRSDGRRDTDSRVSAVAEPRRKRRPKEVDIPSTSSVSAGRSTVVATTELDLRGMTSDEAEDVLLKAIDAAIVEELPSLRIIHGKGTGALRERVSVVLRGDRRVQAYQTATPQEGGWGVTIAEFKS
jgi:DNA mismatch repair protein MutS2